MLTAAAQGAKLKIVLSVFAERASYDLLNLAVNQPSDGFERQNNRGSGF